MQREWVSLEKRGATAMGLWRRVSSRMLIMWRGDTHEKPKKRPEGRRIMKAVAMLTGRSRVFCRRPPQQKTVLPEKYWWFLPSSLLTAAVVASWRASRGDEAADVSFSWP